MDGTLTSLLVVELTLTAAVVAIFIWRRFLDMKEDDHLILNQAEAHLDQEQAVNRQRMGVASRYLKMVGVLWGVMGVLLCGVWISTKI